MLTRVEKGDLFEFGYMNHKGKYDMRTVEFDWLQFGTMEPYYPDQTLLFHGFDHSKQAPRSFNVAKIDMMTFRKIGEVR